jgi:hypothetical protein
MSPERDVLVVSVHPPGLADLLRASNYDPVVVPREAIQWGRR